jgi:hypothetical protein
MNETKYSTVLRHGTVVFDLDAYIVKSIEFDPLPGSPNLYEIFFYYNSGDYGKVYPSIFYLNNYTSQIGVQRYFDYKKWKFQLSKNSVQTGAISIKWVVTKKGYKPNTPQNQSMPFENYVVLNGQDSVSRINNITFFKGSLTVNDYDFFYTYIDGRGPALSSSLYQNPSFQNYWSLDIWGTFAPSTQAYLVSYCLVRKNLFSVGIKLL